MKLEFKHEEVTTEDDRVRYLLLLHDSQQDVTEHITNVQGITFSFDVELSFLTFRPTANGLVVDVTKP